MANIEMEGFDEFINKLEDIKKNAQEIDGTNEISYEELFNEKFMKKYTEYSSIYEMIENSNLDIETEEEIKGVLEKGNNKEEWDQFVQNNTIFDNWEDMFKKANEEWAVKKLGF